MSTVRAVRPDPTVFSSGGDPSATCSRIKLRSGVVIRRSKRFSLNHRDDLPVARQLGCQAHKFVSPSQSGLVWHALKGRGVVSTLATPFQGVPPASHPWLWHSVSSMTKPLSMNLAI